MRNCSSELVLKTLNLQNFATFENQEIAFDEGFNAIVGETGSGKSLILDALNMILGNRADKKLIRKGSNFSTIEAYFITSHHEIMKYLDEVGFPLEENEIVVKRIIYSNGSSKSYINHTSCSLSQLTAFSRRFIDMVGQFENQKLLSANYQLKLLDLYARNSVILEGYNKSFTVLKSLNAEKEELSSKLQDLPKRLDYINFQLNELDELNPSAKDENDLIKEKETLLSINKQSETKEQLLDLFENEDVSLSNILNRGLKLATQANFEAAIINKFNEAINMVDELSYSIFKTESTEKDDNRLQEVLTRLDLYQTLKRKFGLKTDELHTLYDSLSKEKQDLENIQTILNEIDSKIYLTKENCWNLSQKLHESRQSSAKKLNKDLTTAIRTLKMDHATFEIDLIEEDELGINGHTKVDYQAEINLGEGKHSIKSIASGGELSRILLSLRMILSAKDSIFIFLFDEIDTGLGGETAVCIGKALQKVATHGQVLAITHLPQIAIQADSLIKIEKKTIKDKDQSRTISFAEFIPKASVKKRVEFMNPLPH